MNYFWKYYIWNTILPLVVVLGAVVVFGYATKTVEPALLRWPGLGVNPPGDFDEWLTKSFELGALGCVISAGLLWAVVWHLVTLVHSGRGRDLRWLWVVLGVLSVGSIVPFIYLFGIYLVSGGAWIVFGLYIADALLTYVTATWLCTAPTHKYAPPLSAWARRWW